MSARSGLKSAYTGMGDQESSIRRIAAFLGIEIVKAAMPSILEHCGIDYMRAEALRLEQLNRLFVGGAADFFHKGTNGRWREQLDAEEIELCHRQAVERLGKECARWLRTGDEPVPSRRRVLQHDREPLSMVAR